MRIPQVREHLLNLANDIELQGCYSEADRLRSLELELHRRPYVRKARTQRATPLREHILAYAWTYPDADYMQIATACGCNTGRVSEALAGFRK
jgi:hypothetical protein